MLVKSKIFSRTNFSPTYRKSFTNILHQHTFKFLSSPTYSFTNIQKILHQHTFFHQHISPTSLQSSLAVHFHTSGPSTLTFMNRLLLFFGSFGPLNLATVHLKDRPYSPFWTAHFVLDSHIRGGETRLFVVSIRRDLTMTNLTTKNANEKKTE